MNSVGTPLAGDSAPASVAATASLYTSRALASLKRLSPSRITSSRCGGRSCFSTVVAAAASGGATIAPSAIAAAHGIAGTIACATTATTMTVSATAPSASPAIGRQFARMSRGDESNAASSRTGATKSASASSGSRTSVGVPGTSASAAPASATGAGYGVANRRASAASPAPPRSSAMTISNTCMRQSNGRAYGYARFASGGQENAPSPPSAPRPPPSPLRRRSALLRQDPEDRLEVERLRQERPTRVGQEPLQICADDVTGDED